MPLDSSAVRRQFAFLRTEKPIVYFDSAATSQKPDAVLAVLRHMYVAKNANANRGVYPLAEAATAAYDEARKTVARFVGASAREIVFVRGATEGINLVARSFGETLAPGDRIALTVMEHHSNIVPWQQLSKRRDIGIDWIPIDGEGQPDLAALERVLRKGKTKLVAMTGLSNVFGSMPDVRSAAAMAHGHGALLLVDAAQLAAHAPIDVRVLDCDFLAFSSHKLYGPGGIGALFGKEELLERMPPFLGGGDMIRTVTTDGFTPAELPRKFEAGTMPVAEAAAFAAAIGWMEETGLDAIAAHEDMLLTHALKRLSAIEGLTMLGPRDIENRRGCISFTLAGVHPHDLTDVLGRQGICLRAGHHCTQPLHDALKVPASARLSVAAYNTTEEIDRCADAVETARTLLKK